MGKMRGSQEWTVVFGDKFGGESKTFTVEAGGRDSAIFRATCELAHVQAFHHNQWARETGENWYVQTIRQVESGTSVDGNSSSVIFENVLKAMQPADELEGPAEVVDYVRLMNRISVEANDRALAAIKARSAR
jgi:hypothetical protein